MAVTISKCFKKRIRRSNVKLANMAPGANVVCTVTDPGSKRPSNFNNSAIVVILHNKDTYYL